MPALAFFAVAGSVLIALLFLADATLEKSDSPVIATSQRSGLPESSYRPDDVQILTTVPAPAPDMTSQAVRDAQPRPASQRPVKVHPEAQAARAEALPQPRRVTPPMNFRYQPNSLFDRFSIKGQ
jgi:hypothetical protein